MLFEEHKHNNNYLSVSLMREKVISSIMAEKKGHEISVKMSHAGE